jgi:hypothetical protein
MKLWGVDQPLTEIAAMGRQAQQSELLQLEHTPDHEPLAQGAI